MCVAVMDYSVLDGAPESCDPFVVLYLVPPHGAKELGKREKKETKEKKHGEREERGTPRCMVWADMRASLEGLLPWDAIEWLRTLRLLLWLQHTLPLVANHVPHFFRGEVLHPRSLLSSLSACSPLPLRSSLSLSLLRWHAPSSLRTLSLSLTFLQTRSLALTSAPLLLHPSARTR